MVLPGSFSQAAPGWSGGSSSASASPQPLSQVVIGHAVGQEVAARLELGATSKAAAKVAAAVAQSLPVRMSQEQMQVMMNRAQDRQVTQPVLVPIGSLASVAHEIAAKGHSAAYGSYFASPTNTLSYVLSGVPRPPSAPVRGLVSTPLPAARSPSSHASP